MDKEIIYHTHFRRRARLVFAKRALVLFFLFTLSGYLYFRYSSYIALVGCLLFGVSCFFILLSLFRKYPFYITKTHYCLTLNFTLKIPLEQIVGMGVHPMKGETCLLIKDKKDNKIGPLALPWKFIREPQMDVVKSLNQIVGTGK